MRQLVVDGMNVIGSRPDGWWRDRDGAVRRLHRRLARLASTTDEMIVLVLDGGPLDDLPEGQHDAVDVRYARRRGRDAADDRIVDLVEGTGARHELTVVTSDRDLAARVQTRGAAVVGAGSLLRRLDDA